jgi:DNA-binding transcriptional LysR family regulator
MRGVEASVAAKVPTPISAAGRDCAHVRQIGRRRMRLRAAAMTMAPRTAVRVADVARESRRSADDLAGGLEPGVHALRAEVALARSGGFTLLSRLTIQDELRAGALAALPVRHVDLRRNLCAVRSSGVPLSRRARAFWTLLAEQPRP